MKRTYYIVKINCDCGSSTVARTSVKWLFGPRCSDCGRVVGCLEYDVVATVRAACDLDALRVYDVQNREAFVALRGAGLLRPPGS